MQKHKKWAAALMVLVVLGGCSLPRGAALQSEVVGAQGNSNAAFQVVAVDRDNVADLLAWPGTGPQELYRWFDKTQGPNSQVIRPGDRVVLTVWDNDPSSLLAGPEGQAVLPEMTVSPGGTVFVPYVGDVPVRGQTPGTARRNVQDALSVIAPEAQVQLSHRPGRQSAVDAVRGVAQPGSYPLEDRNVSILSLISQAGGIAPDLRNPLVRVIRDSETYEIRASVLLENASQNVILRGGDTLIVDEDTRSFIALGATGTEELVYFEQDRISTLQALALVGGLAETRADLNGLLILREYQPGDLRSDASGPQKDQVVFSFDLTSADGLFAARKFQVHPDDVVIATESPITSARTIFSLIGSVIGITSAVNNVSG